MAKIHFITQGCSANIADSEVMQGLAKEKHELSSLQDAELVVFNTCTVKGPTETFFRKKLKELKTSNKKIIIAGCIPQSEPNELKEFSRIGTYQIKDINKVIDETLKGNIISLLERNDKGRLNLPKIRKNKLIEIVPISLGCRNACAFCKTKHARGNISSYKINDIVRHISNAANEEIKEIWITSQDNSVYGHDIKTNLAELLKYIVSMEKDFKIRIGMANPKYLVPYLDELIKIYKNKKIFKFLHIPLQSGSDKILKSMKRDYKAEDFVNIINKFRKEIPEITIATDIICGFPGETDNDFEETLKIIRKTKPDIINISRFWPRPGTLAAKMKQTDGRTAKERCKTLMKVFNETAEANNRKWLGWKGKVLITEKGKDNTYIGKNYAYKQVVVKGNTKIGKEVDVKIEQTTALDLRGNLNG